MSQSTASECEFVVAILGPSENEQRNYLETWMDFESGNDPSFETKSYGRRYYMSSPRNGTTFTLHINQVTNLSKSKELTRLLVSAHVVSVAFPIINNSSSLDAIVTFFENLQSLDIGIRKLLSKTMFVIPSNYNKCRHANHFRKAWESGLCATHV